MPNPFDPSTKPRDNSDAKTLSKNLKGKVEFNVAKSFFPLTGDALLIDPNAWNQLLPYRLIMVEAAPPPSGIDSKIAPRTTYSILGQSRILSVPIYTLPIAPTNLSIQMPFASQTTILSDGVLVENNGIPLRNITIAGTTGVLPFRPIGAASYDSSLAGELGGNTVRAAKNLAGNAKAVGAAFKNSPLNTKPDPWIENSGYAQFHKLSEFLQLYAEIAKHPKNKNIRLALDIAKDNVTYLVTPKMFSLVRDASSPLEYRYTMQLEAFKRIKISGYEKETFSDALKKGFFASLSKVQKALAALNGIINTISGAVNLIQAIRADVAKLVNMVREVILIAKSIAGVVKAIIDLPQQLWASIKGPILGAINEVRTAWETIPDHAKQTYGIKSAATTSLDDAKKKQDALTNVPVDQYGTQEASAASAGATTAGNPNPTAPGPNGGSTSPKTPEASLLDTILADPVTGSAFMAAINLDQLNIPANIQEKIDEEEARVLQFTRQDFQDNRDYVNQFSRDLSVAFGVGDTLYDSARGYVSVEYPPSTRKPSRQELDILFSLKKFTTILNDLSTFEIKDDNSITESFNFIGNLASSADINLNREQGKEVQPVPYGASIQEIANIYTGSSDNVSEIVLLNGLLPPYIDEDGITVPLLTNGNLNTLNVSNGNDLYINQKIILSSNVVVPFARRILDIKKLSDFNYMVTVDGNSNLDILTTVQNANMQSFRKGTVSSRDTLFIPSAFAPSDVPPRLRPLPFYFKDVDNLAQFTGVDIALGSNNDIIVSRNGQVALAGGLANLQQALRIKFLTPKGSLIRHPNFGLGIVPGTAVSEIKISTISDDIGKLIGADERFGEVQFLDVKLTGPILKINGAATVSQNSTVLPFSLVISP